MEENTKITSQEADGTQETVPQPEGSAPQEQVSQPENVVSQEASQPESSAPQEPARQPETAQELTRPQNGQTAGEQAPQGYQQNGQQIPPQGYQQNGQQIPPQGYNNPGQQIPPNGYPGSMAGPQAGMNQPVQPSKKKGPVIAVIVLCALIILLAVGAVVLALNMFSSPKDKVMKAMVQTMADVDTEFADYLGTKEIAKLTTGGQYSSELGLTLEGVESAYDFEDYSMLSGIGILAENSVDYDARKATSDIKILYNGANMLELDCFAEDNVIGVQMPDLYDGAIAFDSQTLMKDYNEFYLKNVGEPLFQEEYSFNLFDINPESDSEAFLRDYAEDIKNIDEVVEVTRTTEKKTFLVKGKEQSCTGYEVVIPQVAIQVLVDDIFDYLGRTAAKENAEAYDDIHQWLLDLYQDDIVYMVYLDKSGRMVGLDMEYDILQDGDLYHTRSELIWTGVDHLWNDFIWTMDITDDESEETVQVVVRNTQTKEAGEIRHKFTVEMAPESKDEYINLEYKSSLDTESGDARLLAVLDTDEEEILRLELEGAFGDVKAGRQYKFDMDKLALDISGGEYVITLSGKYAIGDLKEDIVIDEDTYYYILDMDDGEISDLQNEIFNNLWNSPLMSMLMGS